MKISSCAAAGMWALAAAAHALPAMASSQPPGFITGVFIGAPDPSGVLPTYDKVPGTSDTNLDIPFPTSVLVHGQNYSYTISSQNLKFSGTCTFSYALTQSVGSTKTTLQSGTIATTACKKGDVFFYDLEGPAIPDSPGAATMTGTVTFGTTKKSLSVPVIIQ